MLSREKMKVGLNSYFICSPDLRQVNHNHLRIWWTSDLFLSPENLCYRAKFGFPPFWITLLKSNLTLFLTATAAQETHLSLRPFVRSFVRSSVCIKDVFSMTLQLCNIATLQHCNIATFQNCNITTLQNCNFVTLQLFNIAYL